MIIGNGLIAKLFAENDREDVIFFASGVSNSLEKDSAQFLREETLIRNTMAENPEKKILYFSTCSIYDSSKVESPYVLHKLKMENIISNHQSPFLILRVSNAVGKGGNPNLLMNYLTRSILNEEPITVFTQAKRNLIDIHDIRAITLDFLDKNEFNKIVNLAYLENFSTTEIIEQLAEVLGKKLNLKMEDSGNSYIVSIPHVRNYFEENNLTDKMLYLKRMITRYYL